MEIAVYGLGRFGLFWATELSRYCTVKVYSRSKKENLPRQLVWVDEDELLTTPALILCVSISSMEEVLEKISARLKPGSLVMDTCSVKVYPAMKMQELLPGHTDILATHPMFGPDSGRNGIKDLPLVLSPVRIRQPALKRWRDFFAAMGLHVLQMDVHEHDKEAAYTQGITHYMGRVFADLGLKPSKIATLGYSKLLEIIEQTCNDPWRLFLDIQRYNPYTKEMRNRLHHSLEKIFSKLQGSLDISNSDFKK
ncbi:MAG: prephenate dehydrogenase/arogenate dehydrogenase family protein [Spirochaetales bacterium]|nr:prephenate dehydrogenase/arogenate dehydrogenase family protein [Spirochaetales bacterium]